MTLWGRSLWALELIGKWRLGCEVFLLLSAGMKDFYLGAGQGNCPLGPMRRPWQVVVLCFGLVYFWQALIEGSLAGQLLVARTLWFFLLRGLSQCQSLFCQKIEG